MSKRKIIIIEDGRDVAGFLDMAIQTLGYETAVAYDGATALELLHQTTPDLILLDMHLPDMNGGEILQRIRSGDQLHQVPVVILTGESQMLSKEVTKQANFTLVKPIDFQTLSQLINRILLGTKST